MAALDQHRAPCVLSDLCSGRRHIFYGLDLPAVQHLRLRNIRRNHHGQRQKTQNQLFCGIFCQKPASTGGDHHRIHHHVFRVILFQLICNHVNQGRAGDHSDLYRIRDNIRKNAVHLLRHKIRSRLLDPIDAGGILGRQGSDHAHAVHSMGGHRFLNPPESRRRRCNPNLQEQCAGRQQGQTHRRLSRKLFF